MASDCTWEHQRETFEKGNATSGATWPKNVLSLLQLQNQSTRRNANTNSCSVPPQVLASLFLALMCYIHFWTSVELFFKLNNSSHQFIHDHTNWGASCVDKKLAVKPLHRICKPSKLATQVKIYQILSKSINFIQILVPKKRFHTELFGHRAMGDASHTVTQPLRS